MADDLAILARMRKANIPPYAYESTLAMEKQPILAAQVKDKSYALHGMLQSYLLTCSRNNSTPASRQVTRCAAVFAKELVLARREVLYLTFADAMILIRRPVFDDEGYPAYLGKGFIVIGDYGLNALTWDSTDREALHSFLVKHLSMGGGLILAETTSDDSVKNSYSNDLANSFATFKSVTVV